MSNIPLLIFLGRNNVSILHSDSQGMHGPPLINQPMRHAGKSSASNIVTSQYGISSMGRSMPSREDSGERAV